MSSVLGSFVSRVALFIHSTDEAESDSSDLGGCEFIEIILVSLEDDMKRKIKSYEGFFSPLQM